MCKYFIIVLLFLSCQSNNTTSSNNKRKNYKTPNIILVMTDDQGWFDAGFNGNEIIKTPYIDMLAKNGVVFNRFYSASAVCSPTRASLITGRNPFRIGVKHANVGHMKKEEITIAELLKKKQYATAHFGKWHLGTLTEKETGATDANRGGRFGSKVEFSIPTMHGYDEFFCTESKVPTFDPMLIPLEFDKGESKRNGWKAIENGKGAKQYGTAYWIGTEQKELDNLEGDDSKIIMDRVIPFIERSTNENSPFFTTIWFHTPHLPVVTDKEHRELYRTLSLEKQIYYGTITAMDEQMGRLWNKLKELGIDDNTMIWFCSDNGPERDTPGSAGNFRDRKRSLYEGGVRVPAFVYWKGHFENVGRVDFPAVTSDYLPTIMDVLDMDFPDDRTIDGESLLPLLEGTQTERKKPIGFLISKQMSWVDNRYKLISMDRGNTFELYDLKNDKEEKNNIISEYPEIAEKMKAEFYVWRKTVEDSSNGADYK